MPKRYVLLLAEGELSDEELRQLQEALVSRLGKAKLIPVPANRCAVIVKTDGESAWRLRNQVVPLAVGGKKLTSVLTSGAVGNLKRRAAEGKPLGKVPQ